MKNFLVIGLGPFGRHLCLKFSELGNDVTAIDKHEELVSAVADFVAYAHMGDCRNEEVLKSLSVDTYDACFVCIGDDFQSSLEVTSLLKELGAKKVISKTNTEVQEKFLLRNGADSVIYPEKEFANKLAMQYSARNVFDYYKLSGNVAIYETAVPKSWIGKSVRELDVRRAYGVNILAVKSDAKVTFLDAERPLEAEDHLYVIGNDKDISKVTKQ